MAGVTAQGQTTDCSPHSASLPSVQEAHPETHQLTAPSSAGAAHHPGGLGQLLPQTGGASGEWALIFLCPKCVFLLRLLLLKARDFSKSPSSDFRFTQTEAVFPLRVETRPTAGSMFSCPSPPAPLLQLQGGAVAPPCLVQLLHCPTFPGTCRPQFGASTSPEVVVGRAMPISHSRSWLASDKIGLKS